MNKDFFDCFGETLGNAILGAIKLSKCHPLIAPQVALSNLALAAQGLYEVKGLPTSPFPLSLIILTCAKSGSGKSEVSKILGKGVGRFEKEADSEFKKDYALFSSKKNAWKKEKEKLESKSFNSVEFEADLRAHLLKEPEQPISPQLITDNPTVEGFYIRIANSHCSQGFFSDEAASFLAGFQMDKNNATKTLSELTKMFDGKDIKRDRVGTGSVSITGKRVTTNLLFQPAVADALINNDQVYHQGFLPRALFMMTGNSHKQIEYYPGLQEKLATISDTEAEKFVEQFNDSIFRMLQIGYNGSGVADVATVARTLNFNPTSLKQLGYYKKRIDRTISGKHRLDYEVIEPSLSRAPELASRIAANLYALDNYNKEDNLITENYTANAINLTDYYLQQIFHHRTDSYLSSILNQLSDLLNWWVQKIIDGEMEEEVSARTLKQYGPNSIRKNVYALLELGVSEGMIKCSDKAKKKYTIMPKGDWSPEMSDTPLQLLHPLQFPA